MATSSAVWKFFFKESSENAQCLLCMQFYSRKGRGTTNLKNHLKSKHKEQYAELLEDEKKSAEKRTPVKPILQRVKYDVEQRRMEDYLATLKDRRSEECFTSVGLWDAAHSEDNEIDKYISEMLVMDDLPFSHVEDVGFTRFVSKAVPKYTLKRRNFYSTMICTDIYGAVCGQMKAMLSDITNTIGNSISFTTDVWWDTSDSVSLFSLTAHAINCNFERVNFVLGVQTLGESHTGEYIARKFNDMVDEWEIPHSSVHCVVRDSRTTVENALFLSGSNNLDCALHKIQLVVEQGFQSQTAVCDMIKKCRRLATHFRQSTFAQDELQTIQERLHLPRLKVLNDSPTRWNSTLQMLQRTLDIKEPLGVYVALNPEMPQFSNIEWITLSQCVKALEPYQELAKCMSEPRSSLADVIPLILCLKKVLQPTTVESAPLDLDSDDGIQEDYQKGADVEIVNYMKLTMRADITERFAGLEMDDNYRVATYLDPRYKGKFFSSPLVTKQVQETVARLCDEFVRDDGDEEPRRKRRRAGESKASSSKCKATSVGSAMALILASSSEEEPEERTKTNSMDMVHKYHKDKRLGADEDPLKWWKENINEYPEIGRLAQQYLSCPPSSTYNTQEEKSNRLQRGETEKLLFLKKNLPLLNFEY